MRPVTNPHHDLHIANLRAAKFHKAAAEERLASELRANRRTERATAGTATGSKTHRRRLVVAATTVLAIAGLGALSTRVEAAPATDSNAVDFPCDHADGYRPMCSMLPGRPDGWFVPATDAD